MQSTLDQLTLDYLQILLSINIATVCNHTTLST